MSHIRRYFLTGLAVVLPTFVSFYILYVVGNALDGLLGGMFRGEWIRPGGIPGLGLLSLVLFIMLIGIITSKALGRRAVHLWDSFLAKVPIPQENIHRIPTEYGDFKTAAGRYEETIQQVFDLEPGQLPEFDLIVLGVGSDGHTGSLFPGSYAAFDTEDLACAVYVLDDDPNRITLTPPVLSAASHLIVLVSGEEKAEILKKILTSEPDEVRYPIHALWPVLDKITWLVDAAAAQSLQL